MAIKLISTKGYGKGNGIKVLVYGAAGSGKTMLCSTAPRPVIISAESGLLSLQEYDIEAIEINTIDDLSDAYDWVMEAGNFERFDTICLDSISEIAEKVLENEKDAVKDGRQAYGNMNDRINRILRNFRDIPGKNVYFSAKIEKMQNQDGMLIYSPSLPGSRLSQGIGYFFDEEFVLRKVNDKDGNMVRILQTSGDLSYEAKDRSGKLDVFEQPDLTYIFNKINGINGGK